MTEVCMACAAAARVESGVIASYTTPGMLHAQCDGSGCECGCDYSRGERCRECGRARTPEQLRPDGSCSDRADCATAIVAALMATSVDARRPPQAVRWSDRPTGLITAPKGGALLDPKKAATRKCECGCGTDTKGTWAPGHDARHAGKLIRAARAGESDALVELTRRWPSKVPPDLRAVDK